LKAIYKILLLLPFVLLSTFLLYKVDGKQMSNFITSFVSISLTIATFSISFSFLQYQFSPYKSLLKSTSKRQLIYSYITIFIALLPLFVLFIEKDYVPTVSLFVIPVLAYMLLFLLILSSEESNPKFLLKRKLRDKSISKFLKDFNEKTIEQSVQLKRLEFSKADETPMHDFGESKYQNVVLKNNPFDFINEVIDVSILNSDLDKFESTIEAFLALVSKIIYHKEVKNLDFKFKINKMINNSFDRLTLSISEQTNSKNIQNRFLEKVGVYLKERALKNEQTGEIHLNMIASLTSFAKKILETGNCDGSLFIVSLNRQLAQRGIYIPPTNQNDRFFELHLPAFPAQIKDIGQKAVALKNSDFLYRCLEELGYLGCTAIKNNSYQVGNECLQSLVQLGREARANNVKCFWRHCMLETIDHADERIWWMLSWVTHLDEKSQKRWVESFKTAYSRLRGYKREIEFVKVNERDGFRFKDSDEPHKESFSQESYYRTVDYSDFQEIKEFKLY
jgi:hypothetical protein